MLINKTNVLTISLVAILGLSSHAFAGKGSGNGGQPATASHNALGDMNRTRSENTWRYKKHQGEKPKYQHQYRHTQQNVYQNTQSNSINHRSAQAMSNE